MTSKSESDIGKLLAPSGKLRVGVFAGSPLSMVQVAKTGETHGISFDLGRELAKRLALPFEHVTYGRVAEVLEGIKAREVDFTVSNATPVRARDVDFSQTLLSLELGYLVPANSPILSLGDIDKTGLRIGVTMGSTSERTLPALLPNASVVPVPSLKEAIHKLVMDHLDVFATNKPILFEMADAMPRARILGRTLGGGAYRNCNSEGPRCCPRLHSPFCRRRTAERFLSLGDGAGSSQRSHQGRRPLCPLRADVIGH